MGGWWTHFKQKERFLFLVTSLGIFFFQGQARFPPPVHRPYFLQHTPFHLCSEGSQSFQEDLGLTWQFSKIQVWVVLLESEHLFTSPAIPRTLWKQSRGFQRITKLSGLNPVMEQGVRLFVPDQSLWRGPGSNSSLRKVE